MHNQAKNFALGGKEVTLPILEAMLNRHYFKLLSEGLSGRHARGICNAALIRYAEGIYGKCAKCGHKIKPDVLEDDPTEVYCRSCQNSVSKKTLAAKNRARVVLLDVICPPSYSSSSCWWH